MGVYKREDILLILLSKLNITNDDNVQINEILRRDIDYPYFLYSCYVNRVDMIVYHNIIKYRYGQYILPKVLKVLRKTFYYNNFRLSVIEKEFWIIIEEFNVQKINYAVIKGFALNKLLFHSENGNYVRDFNDIDFLVLREQIGHIKNILISLGYTQGEYDVDSDDIKVLNRKEILEYSIRSHQTAPFLKKINAQGFPPIIIEIDVNFTIFYGGVLEDNISINRIMECKKIYYEKDLRQFWYLNVSEMFIQLVYHLYRETKYEVKEKEKEAITLQKFNDVREYFKHCIKENEYEKVAALIKEAHVEIEVLWVMEYILDMYGDREITDFIFLIQ